MCFTFGGGQVFMFFRFITSLCETSGPTNYSFAFVSALSVSRPHYVLFLLPSLSFCYAKLWCNRRMKHGIRLRHWSVRGGSRIAPRCSHARACMGVRAHTSKYSKNRSQNKTHVQVLVCPYKNLTPMCMQERMQTQIAYTHLFFAIDGRDKVSMHAFSDGVTVFVKLSVCATH